MPKNSLNCLKTVGSSSIFWTISFLTCTGVIIFAAVAVLYSPGFELPDSEQFQLLSSSHPVEVFDRFVQPAFGDPVMADEHKMSVYLIWGIKPIDNGSGLDPNNVGTLQFDPHFNLVPTENQKWMRRLCRRIQKTSFYDPILNAEVGLNLDACFMDTFVGWMKRDCHHFLGNNQSYKPCCNTSKFPYENSTFHECMGLAARDVYRTPSLYFHPDIAGPKFFIGKNRSNSDNLATFVVRIRTNVTYSVVYDKMNKFYAEFERSFDEIMKDAPIGLENGFFVSSHFDFYDLQKSLMEETWSSLLLSIGLCFLFLCISSRSFTVALGAVVSIFAIGTNQIKID